ncbi:SulP family inorganic anion transporter [Gulosibacter molinativorax]|uniref:SulP family inorganic anion transporter n=1 Tax=Gulosibacter molinativorax TaxID=256821 RepID=A0ABT7C5R4_9MICO|nr:SulP family inorganic anion transporter [Gulosibacter molinativorax]MDJ1370494.1 SulP family inorganic anion transporter [Gulosibacter molinativorax]QUY62095.1 Sulfate permease [Gulosibacter molinativorax]
MPDERPRWQRFFPGIAVFQHYERSWLRGDIIAGITVAAYLVPQVMAYAVIAGLPAVVGLWTVLAPMVIYFFLGTSRKLSIGPESTTALMTAAGVGALVSAAGGPERYAEVAAILAIAVGIICLVASIARLGFLTKLLSRPVLIGYLVGIAVLMIVSQLGKVTKIDVSGANTWEEAVSLVSQLGQAHLPTVLLSVAVLIVLYLSNWLVPRAPSSLITLLLAAGVVALFGLERYGLEVIGQVPQELPEPRIPNLGDVDLWALLPYAMGIAIVGFSDNILTARAFASGKGEVIDPNQELLALGAANVATGFLQGFPVSSSGSRTVLGDAAGARTQVHAIVVVVSVIMVLLFAGPVLESFPDAALGALVIFAATQLIDAKEIRRIGRFRRSELIITGVTAAAVVFFGVLVGIGVAVGLSILDLIRRITRPYADVLGYAPGVPGMHSLEDYDEATAVAGLVVFRYDSPLFFANADDFVERALDAVDEAEPPVEWFLLNAEANTEVDLTAVDALQDLRKQLEKRGVRFAMARVKQDLARSLEPTGFLEEVGGNYIFATLPTAVRAYAREYRKKHGDLPEGVPPKILED